MSVMLCPCNFSVALLMYLFVLVVACLTVFDSVCQLFGETIHSVFGCGCCFIAECYGCV